jgi:hypothetical protein
LSWSRSNAVLGERRGARVRGAGALAEAGHLAAAASAVTL